LDETFELSETERGSNGFGSSGVAGTWQTLYIVII
jgi:hypothetical protein